MVDITSDVTVRASSTLANRGTYTFRAANMLDGRFDTTWQPSAKRTSGVGQSFTMVLKRRKRVAAIRVANGNQFLLDGQDLFGMNSRLRTVEITVGSERKEFSFPEDERGFVEIPVSPPVLASTIRVKVISVWPGSEWPDLAISEVNVLAVEE